MFAIVNILLCYSIYITVVKSNSHAINIKSCSDSIIMILVFGFFPKSNNCLLFIWSWSCLGVSSLKIDCTVSVGKYHKSRQRDYRSASSTWVLIMRSPIHLPSVVTLPILWGGLVQQWFCTNINTDLYFFLLLLISPNLLVTGSIWNILCWSIFFPQMC